MYSHTAYILANTIIITDFYSYLSILASKSDIEFIQKNFSKFTTVDMELTALIHTSNFFNIPISSIKIISDKLEENTNSNNDYKLKSLIWKAKIATILLKLFS